MPIGTLPPKAAKLFEEVYQKYKNGECKGDEKCAAQRAWGAVKQAGWKKGEDGKWHKSEAIAEFSFYISKASFDKATQEMRWSAVASDTDPDLYDERMSIDLYRDFVKRAETQEFPPDDFCSQGWCGGMPYLSLAHYPDLDGKAIAGDTAKLYIDGKMLKAQGTFRDTPLGNACFKSVCSDLYNEENKSREDRVRISIGFLDWAHYHGNFLFERKSLRDRCPMCAQGVGDKMYAKGHLLHLALTRVPVNQRTIIEPLEERSMTTRLEDAASIVGEEIAEELNVEAALVGKSEALVERADDEETDTEHLSAEEQPTVEEVKVEETPEPDTVSVEEPVVEESSLQEDEDECRDKETGEMDEDCAKRKKEMMKSEALPAGVVGNVEVVEIKTLLSQILARLPEPAPVVETPPAHILDGAYDEFKRAFDEAVALESDPNGKLQALQPMFSQFGEVVRAAMQPKVEVVEETHEEVMRGDFVTKADLEGILQPLNEKLGLLVAQLSGQRSAAAVQTATPQRRSLPATQVITQKAQTVEKQNSLKAISERSVGLRGY